MVLPISVNSALRLSRLNSLPRKTEVSRLVPQCRTTPSEAHSQTIARLAIKGAENDMKRFVNHLRQTVSSTSLLWALPAFFESLRVEVLHLHLHDHAMSPSDGDFLDAFGKAVFALEGVAFIATKSALTSDSTDLALLWSRVWPWMQCISNYGPQTPDHGKEGDIAVAHFTIILHYMRLRTSAQIIATTPGVFNYVGRAWVSMSDRHLFSANNRRLLAMRNSQLMLLHPAAGLDYGFHEEATHYMDDLVDGIGNAGCVAKATIVQMKIAFPTSTAPVDEDILLIFRAPLLLVAHALLTMNSEFSLSLLSLGFVKRLEVALCALLHVKNKAITKSEDYSTAIDICASNLRRNFFIYVPTIRRSLTKPFRSAVKRGIISAVHKLWGRLRLDSCSNLELHNARALVAPWLVFRNVLLAIEAYGLDVLESASRVAFEDERVERAWLGLRSLVVERIDFVKQYDNGISSRLRRECDSPSCMNMPLLSELKTCGGCKRAYYCSPACQKSHWEYRHRVQCLKLTSVPVARAVRDQRPISKNEEGFVRCLLNSELTARKFEIAAELFAFLCANPADSLPAPCVTFEFTHGEAELSVQSMYTFASPDGLGWDHLERARNMLPVQVLILEPRRESAFISFPCLSAPFVRLWEGIWETAQNASEIGQDGRVPDVKEFTDRIRSLASTT